MLPSVSWQIAKYPMFGTGLFSISTEPPIDFTLFEAASTSSVSVHGDAGLAFLPALKRSAGLG